MAGSLVNAPRERLRQQAALVLSPHQGGVQPPDESFQGLADGEKPQRRHGLGLALRRDRLDWDGLDGLANEPMGFSADQDLAGGRRLLEPSGHVDRVAGDHSLAGRRVAGHDLARVDPDADPDLGSAVAPQRLVQLVQDLAHLHRRTYGPQGVVFVHRGDAEHSHDGVADELLHSPSVALDHGLHRVEVPRHHPP
jgi:hypothetical protein